MSLSNDFYLTIGQYVLDSPLASITLLSIFLLSGTIFRNILGRGVERPIVAAEH